LLRCPKNTLRDRVPIELSQNRENWRYLQRRKPFGVLAEGLISENSRGDWTPLELFLAGIRGWEAGLRRRIDDGKPLSD